MSDEYSFEVYTTYFTIEEKNGYSLQLNHIKWGNNEPKYDLRRWKDGKPLKGLSMTADSLKYVCKAMAILAARTGIADQELKEILNTKEKTISKPRLDPRDLSSRAEVLEILSQPRYVERHLRVIHAIEEGAVLNYLNRNGITDLSELVSKLQDRSIYNLRSFTKNKEDKIYEALTRFISNVDLEDIKDKRTLFNDLNPIYEELPVSALSVFMDRKKPLERLSKQGYRTVGELKGITDSELESIVGVGVMIPFLDTEENLQLSPEKIIAKIWDNRSEFRYGEIALQRAQGSSLQTIANSAGLSRERTRQLVLKYYQGLDPFLRMVKKHIDESTDKSVALHSLFPQRDQRRFYKLWEGKLCKEVTERLDDDVMESESDDQISLFDYYE